MKNKLERFAEIATFKNVVEMSFEEISQGFPLKGLWKEQFFGNENPIVLELGCGKGEYTIGLAKANPNINFIGVDIKGNRIWKGASFAIENRMTNVGFLRTRIDFIENCFGPNEIDEIWITFPDPQPQKSKSRKRLTSPMFLRRYKNICKNNAIIHLKTDNEPLWTYTIDVLKNQGNSILRATNDLYATIDNSVIQASGIQTHYEKLFSGKGFKICYLKFTI